MLKNELAKTDVNIDLVARRKQYLRNNNVHYQELNKGLHLVIDGLSGQIDYWPLLAKWKCRNSLTKGTSINDLITYAKKGTLP